MKIALTIKQYSISGLITRLQRNRHYAEMLDLNIPETIWGSTRKITEQNSGSVYKLISDFCKQLQGEKRIWCDRLLREPFLFSLDPTRPGTLTKEIDRIFGDSQQVANIRRRIQNDGLTKGADPIKYSSLASKLRAAAKKLAAITKAP